MVERQAIFGILGRRINSILTRQLPLPKFKKIARLEKEGKLPQPRVARFRAIKKFELLHRPFDLRFRGRINKWLSQIKANKKLKFDEIINLYFFSQPPKSKWLNQDEVIQKTDFTSKKKLRIAFVESLIKIWSITKS